MCFEIQGFFEIILVGGITVKSPYDEECMSTVAGLREAAWIEGIDIMLSIYIYIYAYIHTYIHTYIQRERDGYIHYIYIYTHTIHMYIYIYIYMCLCWLLCIVLVWGNRKHVLAVCTSDNVRREMWSNSSGYSTGCHHRLSVPFVQL